MPKKGSRRRKSNGRAKVRARQAIRMSGRTIVNMSYNASFSFSEFSFKPSTIDRLSDIRKIFELYRLVGLKATVLPTCTGPIALGIVPGHTSGSYSGWTYVSVGELTNAKLWYPGQTVPIRSSWNRKEVGQSLNWLLTTDADGPACGVLIGGPATTAVTALVLIEYDVEFMGPVASGFETVNMPISRNEDDEKNAQLINVHDDSYLTVTPPPTNNPRPVVPKPKRV